MNRFLLGFIVGVTMSAAAVLALTPKSGEDTRQSILEQINAAVETGRQAAAAREEELWAEFRRRLAAPDSSRADDHPHGASPMDNPFSRH